jgi:hypothetical protein
LACWGRFRSRDLSTAYVSGEIKDQEDEQNETETASAYHGSTEVKTATAKHEHQNNQDNEEIHIPNLARARMAANGVFTQCRASRSEEKKR